MALFNIFKPENKLGSYAQTLFHQADRLVELEFVSVKPVNWNEWKSAICSHHSEYVEQVGKISRVLAELVGAARLPQADAFIALEKVVLVRAKAEIEAERKIGAGQVRVVQIAQVAELFVHAKFHLKQTIVNLPRVYFDVIGQIWRHGLEQIDQIVEDAIQMVIFDHETAQFAGLGLLFARVVRIAGLFEGVQRPQTKQKLVLNDHFELLGQANFGRRVYVLEVVNAFGVRLGRFGGQFRGWRRVGRRRGGRRLEGGPR
ncbi:hypothetical protein BpHYR1_032813 [Brachionus plicatilis]|uniref:Uncharacterized protein n=1 Tax=Brachionus plicatilis TaxID=10195 RepID=A0A3M7SGI1_BRAPC|nr:hypothetical protein BpHYR1_032813 [Brachionus plicatilis]